MIDPLISVIVLTHNGRRWLGPCLDALRAQQGAAAFEIIVVDNASLDDSVGFVRAAYPEARVVALERNIGFAAGNNRGAAEARGTWLAFLNNDTIAAPDWLARLVGKGDAPAGFPLVTSRIVRMDRPEVVDSAGDGYFTAGGAYKRGFGGRADDYAASGEVFGACGAAFAIERRVFDELGGFDERFFMVYEDVDLSYRARLRGHRCWYAADARVRHAVSGTLGPASAAAVYYGQRNLEWTWLKNTPTGLLLRTLPSHALYSVAGLVHYGRRGRLGAALRGKLAAAANVASVLGTRADVQRSRTATARELTGAMTRRWFGIKRTEKARPT